MKIIEKLLGKITHDLKIVISGKINIKIIDSNHKNKIILSKDIPLKADIKI